MADLKRKANLDRLRDLNNTELADELSQVRAKLFDMRRQHVTRQLENFAGISTAKKNIARILTLQRERQGQAGGN